MFQILPSKNTPYFARFFDRNQKIHGDLKVGNPFKDGEVFQAAII